MIEPRKAGITRSKVRLHAAASQPEVDEVRRLYLSLNINRGSKS